MVFAIMATDTLLRDGVKAQLTTLQGLLTYLEGRERLEAKEYLFCQAGLHDTVKHLKRLERLADRHRKA